MRSLATLSIRPTIMGVPRTGTFVCDTVSFSSTVTTRSFVIPGVICSNSATLPQFRIADFMRDERQISNPKSAIRLTIVLRGDAAQFLPHGIAFFQHLVAQRGSLAQLEIFFKLFHSAGAQDHAVHDRLAQQPAKSKGNHGHSRAPSDIGHL